MLQQTKEKGAPSPLKVPPQNVEAEQTILAGVLINNDALNQIVDVLSPEDFYREGHAHLFEGMIELYNNNEPIDLITLPQFLREKGLLEKAGGMDYLASLADAVSTSAGILFHAQIVRDLSVRRKLISQCSVISEACFQNWEPTEDLLEMAEQSIFDIAEDKIGESFSTLEDVIKGSFRKLESVAEHEGFITGVPTGFKDFDRYTAGLQPSDLIIIAGLARENGLASTPGTPATNPEGGSCLFLEWQIAARHETSGISCRDRRHQAEDRVSQGLGLAQADGIGQPALGTLRVH
jgi:replicative DNA helicase